MKWHPIPEAVYRLLFASLPELVTYAGCTDLDGSMPGHNGKPYILTEWGFTGCWPLLRHVIHDNKPSFFVSALNWNEYPEADE